MDSGLREDLVLRFPAFPADGIWEERHLAVWGLVREGACLPGAHD